MAPPPDDEEEEEETLREIDREKLAAHEATLAIWGNRSTAREFPIPPGLEEVDAARRRRLSSKIAPESGDPDGGGPST